MTIALGIGCDRGTPVDTLRHAVAQALARVQADWSDVSAVGSITLKADEPALCALAAEQGWAIRFYTPEQLAAVPVPNPSETVRRYTGTASVSEAAALMGAGAAPRDAADAAMALLLEKHKLKGEDGRNATVSVARVCGGRDDAQRLFTQEERESFHALLAARRDMRHFLPGQLLSSAVRERLMAAVHTAPSVGLMQPWRFLRITDASLREQLARAVDAERLRTAEALGPRAAEFLALKVEGLRECAELWVALLAPDDGTVFGRRTLPAQTAWCSAAAAVQNLWLAARAENLGMGWVSLFDPAEVARLLQLPEGAETLGLLCIGPVAHFYPAPMLSATGWRQARPREHLFGENTWGFGPEPVSVPG